MAPVVPATMPCFASESGDGWAAVDIRGARGIESLRQRAFQAGACSTNGVVTARAMRNTARLNPGMGQVGAVFDTRDQIVPTSPSSSLPARMVHGSCVLKVDRPKQSVT